MIAVLEKGEAVLDRKKQNSVMQMIDLVNALSAGVSGSATAAELMSAFGRSVSIENESAIAGQNTPAQINMGDVYIYGADGDTVEQHIEINRRFANEIFDLLNIKK